MACLAGCCGRAGVLAAADRARNGSPDANLILHGRDPAAFNTCMSARPTANAQRKSNPTGDSLPAVPASWPRTSEGLRGDGDGLGLRLPREGVGLLPPLLLRRMLSV